MFPICKYNKGVSVIEIITVVAVIAITLTSLLGLASFSLGISTQLRQTNMANDLAQESLEAVRNFRDGTEWDTNGLGVLATSTDYFSRATGTPQKWELVLGKETIDIFERKIVLEDVRRDANYNIVASGGNFASDTKRVTATVSWSEKGENRLITLVTYLTNWKR